MGYKHLTINQREVIWLMRTGGFSCRQIAERIEVNKGTVSRELKRNGGIGSYLPVKAQAGYVLRRLKCRGRHILDDGKLYEYVKKKLFEEQWSPEQIAGRLSMERGEKVISFPTIYREIYSGRFDRDAPVKSKTGAAKLLRRKGKSLRGKKSGIKRGGIKISNELSQRPEEANSRERLGDWEADTVIGKQGKACLVTMNDRKSLYLLLGKSDGKNAGSVKKVMIKLLEGKPCETITPDRGTEFAGHEDVTDALGGVQFYFPPPSQPWQRGMNENCNGLLREYFPKGRDLSDKSDEYIQAVADKINKRPRKTLGWKTPFEVFYSKSLHLY